jgi:putative colanic acid biosynthesis acetyltransferase WcaF
VVIKPRVNVKYPWNVEVGEDSWIGEGVWLDSLGSIVIGHDACISQGAYLCTGNHDWSKASFDLIVKPIVVEDGAWIGATAVVLGGVTVGRCSVVTAGTVVVSNTAPDTIYRGNPARATKMRWGKGPVNSVNGTPGSNACGRSDD